MLLQKPINYLNCFIQSKEPGESGQPGVHAVRPATAAPKRELDFATMAPADLTVSAVLQKHKPATPTAVQQVQFQTWLHSINF
jgi:hypothetical protein